MRPSQLPLNERHRYYRLFLNPQLAQPPAVAFAAEPEAPATLPAPPASSRPLQRQRTAHMGFARPALLIGIGLLIGCIAGFSLAWGMNRKARYSAKAAAAYEQLYIDLATELGVEAVTTE